MKGWRLVEEWIFLEDKSVQTLVKKMEKP